MAIKSSLCALRTDQEHSTFVVLYFRMVPPGSVSDKWTVVLFLTAYGEQGASGAASQPRYKIGTVREYGRSIRDDSCARLVCANLLLLLYESRRKNFSHEFLQLQTLM